MKFIDLFYMKKKAQTEPFKQFSVDKLDEIVKDLQILIDDYRVVLESLAGTFQRAYGQRLKDFLTELNNQLAFLNEVKKKHYRGA